jgi:hypothetical protein
MAERDVILREKVTYTGICDFKGLYMFAWNWFKDELYGVDEVRYVEKVTGNAKDLDIEWRAVRPVSDFFKIDIRVTFEVRGLSDVEVEIDGVKKQMNKGKVDVSLRGTLVRDPDSKWDRSPWYKFFREIYSKYVVPGRVFDMKLKVQKDVQVFKDEVKAYLDLMGKRS